MNLSTEELGRWIDNFVNMGALSFQQKLIFFDELIQYYASPSREEYEKCRSLKRMTELLQEWTVNRTIPDKAELNRIALETTEIIYYLVVSIQTEINTRIESLKSALTKNER